jgi:primosomal protein N' (replication factor Y)
MTDNQQGELFETAPAQWELDAEADRLVATVVFPELPRGEFDYLIPDELRDSLKPGCRVRVPLGRGNRTLVGYCVATGLGSAAKSRLKAVASLVDATPLISPDILELSKWIADYYLCDRGPALEAVVPAGVRGKAGTRQVAFVHAPTSVVARLAGLKLPAKQRIVMDHVVGSPKAVAVPHIKAAVGCTDAPIKSLVEKGLLTRESRRVYVGDPEAAEVVERTEALTLNKDQEAALGSIVSSLDERRHEVILLHGVTGSGKTEVYIQAIQHVISFGRQAIVLVPEISLTPQTRRRFRSRFDNVAVLHSNLSNTQRHGEWQRIARGEAQVIVGARSAVFAPVPHLGMIVIDEEHEPSFKQDVVPRYHARQVAVQRAAMAGVPLVLGSATPALESWHRAVQKDYQLVRMPNRVLDRPLPRVSTIDLRNEYQARGPRGSISRPLAQAMKAALSEQGQIILLLNRRGFSTHIQCPACGTTVRCDSCDIALTHHRSGERAVCHYCDFQMPTPPQCPTCSFDGIRFGGLGTQRLEAEVRARFPTVHCLRMDTDTMRGHGAHEAALNKFRNGEVQILLGTQMIAKGLDFPNVTLVGVINADTGLHLPDFRAAERTFQLVTQVAGRTGRGDKGGRVMVQSFNPEERAILSALHHDYVGFAEQELPERQAFYYPPFTSVMRIVFRGEAESTTEAFADHVGDVITEQLEARHIAARTLGPVAAPLAKLRGKFRYHMLVQTEDRAAVCDVLRTVVDSAKAPKGVQWIIDADAISMM